MRLKITILIWILIIPSIALAQRPNFELDCPGGTQPIVAPGTATFNPTTGKMRQQTCVDQNGNVTFADLTLVGDYNSIRTLNGTTYPFTGTGLTTAISDCITDTLCPGVDARALTSAVTATSTITLSKPMFLWIGDATVTLGGTPGLLVSAGIKGVSIHGVGMSGQSATSTTFSCTGTATDCIRWLGTRGNMSDLTIFISGQNATHGLTLNAVTAGQDVSFNTFTNISVIAPSTSTADGIRLVGSDATHKVSFNQFINFEVVDFGNAQDCVAGTTVGGTNNFFIGGQFRQTTAARGNGILLNSFCSDNKWYGGNYSFYVNAVSIQGGANTTGNGFFGIVPESNTNAATISAGAADNQFINVPFGSQGFSDSGIRTVVLNGNNTIGPGASGLSKLGGPISFVSIGGGNSGIPAATGTNLSIAGNLGSPVLGRIYVGDNTGFQLDWARRTGSTDTVLGSWFDTGLFTSTRYGTVSNCSSAGGTCASAPSGSVTVAAAATTVTVSTTAVTANSQIFITRDDSLGTKLGVTCNTATAMTEKRISARTGGTSFQITVAPAPVTNPYCLSYIIVN